MEPIPVDEIPGYSAVISRPMDIETVRKGQFLFAFCCPSLSVLLLNNNHHNQTTGVKNGIYQSPTDAAADVSLHSVCSHYFSRRRDK